MQSLHAISKQPTESLGLEMAAPAAFLSRWLTRIFGCWHMELSRPFTREGQTHRVCMECGARRQFNLEKWELVGDYYYDAPPVINPVRTRVRQQPRPILLRSAA
ncbi:MAG TPA: hypothetical protein VGB17_01940 [Pyrinomonadaceae bacterium]|jgi:hypothetical protein